MRKQTAFALCMLFMAMVSYAQGAASASEGAVPSSIQVADVMAPTSNIDLLKQSLEKQKQGQSSTPVSSVQQTSSAAGAAKAVPTQAANQAAAATQSSATTTKQASTSQSSKAASTLEMPINMGDGTNAPSVVKTQVQPRTTATQAKKSQATTPKRSKTRTVAASGKKTGNAAATAAKTTDLETRIEKENALLPENQKASSSAPEAEDDTELSAQEQQEEAELQVAARMLRQAKNTQASGRAIPPPAAKNATATVPSSKRRFNPSVYRPGVEWKESQSKNFTVYTQKRDIGSGTANMTAVFEQAYNTLKRYIPWMMSDRVRVFVYQDYQSYLKYEPNAKPWSRALAYPTRGEIVVYDEPNKTQELKEMFTHELVHIFTQKFFDKRHTYQIMTPAWLDEGLAVLMEDQAYNGTQGGPWAQDFKTLNFQRDPSTRMSLGWSSSPSARRKPGRTVTFMPFEQFIKEGSLNMMESNDQTQDWYFQAYTMVRFLLNPGNSSYPSKRMQFEQFTKLLAEGEAVRDPSSGFLKKDASGKQIYQPYSVEKALKKVYYYNDMSSFEDAFWKWASSGGSGYSF